MATTINDIVLVHIDGNPGFYARIEQVSPDRKPGWWQVKLLVLTLPLQVYTWTLEEEQINGTPFTMGGTPIRLEKVECPSSRQEEPEEHKEEPREEEVEPREEEEEKKSKPGGKVVSIFDHKKQS